MITIAVAAAIIWFSILLAPWRAWSTRERLDDGIGESTDELSDVAVLIPARNESGTITETLQWVAKQGDQVSITLVDDQSDDGTGARARAANIPSLQILDGAPLPAGWSGKVWALEQGRRGISRPFTVLLDADISLSPGVLPALREKMSDADVGLVSVMVELARDGFWATLLHPAFVYFFKLLYPFRLSNARGGFIAAAAGGCIMIRTRVLEEIGGFGALKDALIDDCALAKLVKLRGYRTWLGLTRKAVSRRESGRLSLVWQMVVRSAYTQLHYSPWWLLVCTVLMITAFLGPLVGLLSPVSWVQALGVATLMAMIASYAPTLRYYDLSYWWGLAMPGIGVLFLLMTWHSAIRFWCGRGTTWKGRHYSGS